MEKIINIDLKNEEDLIDKYNNKHVSRDLINYILDQTQFTRKQDTIKIVINKNFDTDSIGLIKMGLRTECLKIMKETKLNNIKQITFLLIGLICLILYAFLDNIEVFSEIILIGGWILIGEAIEIQLFSDSQIKRNKMIIKKILNAEYEENMK